MILTLTLRCFGYLRRSCPEKAEVGPSQASNSEPMGGDAGHASDMEAGPSTAGEWASDPRADGAADADPDTQDGEGGGAAGPAVGTGSKTDVGQECLEPESDGLGANADVGVGAAAIAAVGSNKVCFLNDVSAALQNCCSDDYLFMGGDFNCTEDDDLDRNHTEPHTASKRTVCRLLQNHSLCDVWRVLHQNVRQYSWAHARDGFMSLARLDRLYCFKHHLNIFKECVIVPVGFSDHSLVLPTVFIANLKPKSAYWHFNTSLLCDVNFKQVFSVFWASFQGRKQQFRTLRQWWDYGKVEIRQLCQQYTFNVSRHITDSMKQLEVEILELQRLMDSGLQETRVTLQILSPKKLLL